MSALHRYRYRLLVAFLSNLMLAGLLAAGLYIPRPF